MIKWFVYIVVLLIFAPCLSSANKIINNRFDFVYNKLGISLPPNEFVIDTVITKNSKKQDQEEKKKIKEVAKAKRQPKPEKIESGDNTAASKPKPKRQRRPEGLVRPPEIPRRNGN